MRLIKILFLSIIVQLSFANESLFKVKTINFLTETNESISNPALPYIISHKVGGIFSPERLVSDIEQLLKKFPKYSDITSEILPVKEEQLVNISFTFHQKRNVAAIILRTNNKIDEIIGLKEDLKQGKTKQFKPSLIDEDLKYIKNSYIVAGYPNVEVTQKTEVLKSDETKVKLIYKITSKESKQFLGRVTLPKTVIKKSVMKKYIKSSSSTILQKNILNMNEIEQDKAILKKLFMTEGYKYAKVDYKIKKAKKNKNSLIFSINPGKRLNINSISIIGNKEYSVSKIENLITVKKNSAYSEKEIRKSLYAIKDAYGEKGFVLAKLDAHYDEDNGELTFFIAEGIPQYITKITITGNEKLTQDIILQDVTFAPSELVNSSELNKTLRRMQKTKYYEHVSVDYIPESKNSGTVLIKVAEANNQTLDFNAGFTNNGFTGTIGYTNPNIFNSGNGISISATKTQEMARLRALYRDPHFAGTDIEMLNELSYLDLQYTQFRNSQIEMKIMFKKLINENLKLGLGTRLNFLNVTDVSQALEAEVNDAEGSSTVVGLLGTLAYVNENRSATGDVTSGVRVKLSLYPSYTDKGAYIRSTLEANGTLDLGSTRTGYHHTLSGRITLGYATNNTPFYERFYAGGTNTIRGYRDNSITSNNVTGGNGLASTSVSYSFPIWKDVLRGLVFVDTAIVTDHELEQGELRVASGFGVRANLRQTFLNTVIEAGFSFALDEDQDSVKRPFYFIIGDYDPAFDL